MTRDDRAKEIFGSMLPVLEGLPMGVLAIDASERIFYYNHHMGRMDDLGPEDMLGFKISEVYSVRDLESPTVEALRTGRPVPERYMNYKTALGRRLASLNNAFPLFRGGEKVGALCFSLDVTELMRHVSDVKDPPPEAAESEGRVDFSSIIGKNPVFREAVEVAKIAAAGPSPVMLVGETGTGKDLFAQAIHNRGPRSKGRFVPLNCSAIPEPLLEGLLFGTTRGAFTGAEDRPGLFEHASGGTLFLDELNSMPVTLQAKLLRVIQDQRVRRVGGLDEKKVDARIISAVGDSPGVLVAAGRLRRDLYFRLGVVQVAIPPLRERPEDIPELVRHLFGKIFRRLGREVEGLSPEETRLLQTRPWPGNVRELEHVLESALNFVAGGETLDLRHIQRAARHSESSPPPPSAGQVAADPSSPSHGGSSASETRSLKEELLRYERGLLVAALRRHGGSVTKAANSLGLSQQLLVYKMRKFKLTRSMFG